MGEEGVSNKFDNEKIVDFKTCLRQAGLLAEGKLEPNVYL